MTIKMRLDTEGLRALIASNPELEVEIGKEVMKNISDDKVREKVEARIAGVLSSMITQTGSWHNPTYEIKNANLLKAVNAAAVAAIGTVVDKNLDTIIKERVSSAIRVERESLIRDIKSLIKEAVTPEMAREVLLMSLNK